MFEQAAQGSGGFPILGGKRCVDVAFEDISGLWLG